MAKKIVERENLLRDAVQMKLRGQANICDHEVFIGFRPQGQCSIYYDQDPVFQFNARCELRRVYFHGERYAALNGTLMHLSSETGNPASDVTKVQLVESPARRNLQPILDYFESIRCQLLNNPNIQWQTVGVSSTEAFQTLVSRFLSNVGCPIKIAEAPNA